MGGIKKREICILLTALFLLLALPACNGAAGAQPTPSPTAAAACSPTPYAEPKKLALGYAGGRSLHPLFADDQGSLDIDSLVYDGLFRLDSKFEPQPALAESASMSEDGLSWTVKLRDGVVFSDGTPLTASQVASCIQQAKGSARYASRLAAVTDITAGEGTVTIALATRNGALPALLDIPIFLEQGGDAPPLGTGPYFFYGDGTELNLFANANWWQGTGQPYETIPLYGYSSPEQRAEAFGREVTAVTCDFNASSTVGYAGAYETHDYPATTMLYVGFNAKRGQVCADATVRQALSRCLDRGEIAGTLLSGHASAAALPVSPMSGVYDSGAARGLDYDLEAAAALLEEAGWTKNDEGLLARRRQTMTLTLCVNRDSTVKRAIAGILVQNLAKLGITTELHTLDWEEYTAALANGNFDLYLGEVKLTADFDVTSLISGDMNYGGYDDKLLEQSLWAFRAAAGDQRSAAASAFYTAFVSEVPFAPLCFKNDSLLISWGMAGNLTPMPGAPFAGIEGWSTAA